MRELVVAERLGYKGRWTNAKRLNSSNLSWAPGRVDSFNQPEYSSGVDSGQSTGSSIHIFKLEPGDKNICQYLWFFFHWLRSESSGTQSSGSRLMPQHVFQPAYHQRAAAYIHNNCWEVRKPRNLMCGWGHSKRRSIPYHLPSCLPRPGFGPPSEPSPAHSHAIIMRNLEICDNLSLLPSPQLHHTLL